MLSALPPCFAIISCRGEAALRFSALITSAFDLPASCAAAGTLAPIASRLLMSIRVTKRVMGLVLLVVRYCDGTIVGGVPRDADRRGEPAPIDFAAAVRADRPVAKHL